MPHITARPLLHCDNVRLRALEPEDLDILYAWENDTAAWVGSTNMAPLSRPQLHDYISNYDGDIFAAHQLRLMVVDDAIGSVVGIVDLYDFDADNRRAGVGIYIGKEYRGQGYGHTALELLADYASRRIGMHQVYATVIADNAESLALFKACGFKTSGRLRSWVRVGQCRYADAIIVQRLLEP